MNRARKTVIITGATSFVGMHLCQMFTRNNWHVIAGHSKTLDSYSDPQSKRVSNISKIVKFEHFDICNKLALTKIVDKYKPNLWIQHAGFAYNYNSNDYDFKNGLIINSGSIPILFQVLKDKGCGIIITGTEAEYGPSNKAHAENKKPNPSSLYGITKLTQTITAKHLSNYYDIPTRVARIFLPFGSLDNPRKIIPQVVEALRNNKSIDLSHCNQKRDFIAISDVCEVYRKIADDLSRGNFDIYNVCSGRATKLRKFLIMTANCIDADEKLLKFGKIPLRKGEPNVILGNPKKTISQLSWSPLSLNQAIKNEFSNA